MYVNYTPWAYARFLLFDSAFWGGGFCGRVYVLLALLSFLRF